MPQKRLCFGLAGCVWVASFEPYVLSHHGACFAYISPIYGRFGGPAGSISPIYGSYMRQKV